MNERQRFIRKLMYAAAIAALLLPVSWLSQPATKEADGKESDGGVLAQMRKEHQLGQASLGEIDPASQTIKLATLGLHCVAFNILWEQANHYRKVEDWTSLSATLEQMTRLEPNYVSVWIFQGWNLSYNISVEFDNYKDRYHWVIRGIDYLKEGTVYNKDEPQLLSEIGRVISQKIGRADEHVQFRRLFRDDDDFNGSLPRSQRDNWLVGRDWLLRAQQLADKGVAVKGQNPSLFHSRPAMCLVNYAEALEEEGTFGEVAKDAWNKAAEGWKDFSNRDLPTLYNMFIRLGDKEAYDEKSKQAQAELAKLTPPGVREQIIADKRAALTDDERAAYDTPPEKRTSEQNGMMYQILDKMEVHHLEIADRIQGPDHPAALQFAEEATQADFVSGVIDTERGIINHDYWLLRCQVEPDDNTLAARKNIYDGDQAYLSAQLAKAPQLYAAGLENWRKVLDTHPALLKDTNLVDELVESINRYRKALDQEDQKFPSPFILQDVLDVDAKMHSLGPEQAPAAKPAEDASPAATQPAEAAAPAAPAQPEPRNE